MVEIVTVKRKSGSIHLPLAYATGLLVKNEFVASPGVCVETGTKGASLIYPKWEWGWCVSMCEGSLIN